MVEQDCNSIEERSLKLTRGENEGACHGREKMQNTRIVKMRNTRIVSTVERSGICVSQRSLTARSWRHARNDNCAQKAERESHLD
eukprot:5887159-Pleurochrysis_carterae.AAC.1